MIPACVDEDSHQLNQLQLLEASSRHLAGEFETTNSSNHGESSARTDACRNTAAADASAGA